MRRIIFKIKYHFLLSSKDKALRIAIRRMTALKPKNIHLYRLALVNNTNANSVSVPSNLPCNNERLEYLGDAVLGMVVAEYLFLRFPSKDEGFLTQVRSRIVNRENLNQLCRKIGLDELLKIENKTPIKGLSVYGNTLEAFIGAIYLDKGFELCREFIVNQLLLTHSDIEALIHNDPNYKSKLVEWSQRNSHQLDFRLITTNGQAHHKEFIVEVVIDEKQIAIGSGFNKKKAEQFAAEKACELLEIK